MNILRLVYEWPPPWDGLAPASYELTQAQVRLGHRVTVFCGGGFKNLGRDKTYEKALSQGRTLRKASPGGLRVFRFPRALRYFGLFLTTSPTVLFGYLFLKLTGRAPDLVHGHGHITLWFNLYKLLFGWLDKTPYILHLHITAAGRAAAHQKAGGELDFWTRYFEWPLHKLSDWLGVRVADGIVCVSARVKEEAVKFYRARAAKLVVVENGVNVSRFFLEEQPSQGRTLRKLSLEGKDPSFPKGRVFPKRVLYIGALRQRKGVHFLIRALSLLPDGYRLTIVGRKSTERNCEVLLKV